MSRTRHMLRVATRAGKWMEDDDAADVIRFVQSQMQPDGGFRGRAAVSDLYYTVFGGSCLLALGKPPAIGPFRRYLDSFGNGESLDFVHVASLARCWAALPYPLSLGRGRKLLPRLEGYRAADGGYNPDSAAAARGTVYGSFIAFLTYEETGGTLPEPEAMLAGLESLRTAGGGYANAPATDAGITTATSAAVLLRHWLEGKQDPEAIAALRRCECADGGFLAFERAPSADLLSTATALYALRAAGSQPARIEPHLDFIESLWDDCGGFRGHPADPVADCEYTFYALLALGALHDD